MPWHDITTAEVDWQEHDIPQSKSFGDIYYSSATGLAEARTIFLEAVGLPDIWQGRHKFTIGETGFGTGLNFMATMELWSRTRPQNAWLDYISAEQFPLKPDDLVKALSQFAQLKTFTKQLSRQYPPPEPGFHRLVFADNRVRLTLMLGPALAMLKSQKAAVDAWYLDGFAPRKNPDMWSQALFDQIARLSAPNARLATFTAASDVRRGLQSAGFNVTRLKGYARKRERIFAQIGKVKMARLAGRRRKVSIIGAGIAGCCLAYELNLRGFDVSIFDRNHNQTSEAKGNSAALISPKLILGNDPYGRFLTACFLYATKFYDRLSESPWLQPRGLLSIAMDAEQAKFQQKLLLKHRWSEHDQRHLKKGEIDAKWGLKSDFGGLFYQRAGSLDTAKLLKLLANNIPVEHRDIKEIAFEKNQWLVRDDTGSTLASDVLVVASGLDSYGLMKTLDSPFIANRGQVCLLEADAFSDDCPSLAFGKYLSAPFDNGSGVLMRLLGASYKRTDDTTRQLQEEDSDTLMAALRCVVHMDEPKSAAGQVGFRATTIDHMPVMGPVPDMKRLGVLPRHRQKITPGQLAEDDRLPGLYLLAGLASRGFQTAPLLAASLAAMIEGTPQPLDAPILNALDPARFPLHSRKMQLSS